METEADDVTLVAMAKIRDDIKATLAETDATAAMART